jgi:dihydrofolate synthase / folylpolyglutamate synthase
MSDLIDSLLQPFAKSGINLGLDRIHHLLSKLNNPHHYVPIIHVAGTNGKGSVCAYLSAVLTHCGYKTGRYISPHLVDWNERFCINNIPIDSDRLISLITQVINAIDDTFEPPTIFEIITATAWLYFAQEKVDIAVIEVGLGGRLDSTNVCDRPLATIITSISLEHQEFLGDTLGKIAGEKAGILKAHVPAIIGQLPSEAIAVIQDKITELNCPAYFPESAQIIDNNLCEFQGLKYKLPLKGQFQLANSTLAITTLKILQQQGWKISDDDIIKGIEKTQWLGRIQWIKWQNREILIDGAHNTEAAIALRQYADTLPQKSINWVMGMLATKDHENIFKALLKESDRLYLVPIPESKSAHPEKLAELAQNIYSELTEIKTFDHIETALIEIIKVTKNEEIIILCGSLYLLGYFLKNHGYQSTAKSSY